MSDRSDIVQMNVYTLIENKYIIVNKFLKVNHVIALDYSYLDHDVRFWSVVYPRPNKFSSASHVM